MIEMGAMKKKSYAKLGSIEEEGNGELVKVSESSAYYMFHKLLSNENYNVGKVNNTQFSQNVNDYIGTFPIQYKNTKESANLLPQPVFTKCN